MALKSGRVGIHPSQVDPITGMLLSSPGGASDLSDLDDVSINNPELGQLLVYDGNKWENQFASISPITPRTLASLQDVAISSASNDQILRYNSTSEKWENEDMPAIPAAQVNSDWNAVSGVAQILNKPTIPDDLNDLIDVDIDSPADGEYLMYDSTSGKWVNSGAAPGPVVPDGKTVTPTDDIQTWLACAGITDKTYTTLNEVLADSTALLALMSNNNAVDYLVRSTTWASGITANSTAMTDIGANNYCASTLLDDSTWRDAICNSTYFESVLTTKVPTMTSDTTPSGECIGTTPASGFQLYYAFNGNSSYKFVYTNGTTPTDDVYIGYHFTSPTVVNKFSYQGNTDSPYLMPTKVRLQGSNDNSTWVNIGAEQDHTTADANLHTVIVTNDTACSYYRLRCTARYYSTNGEYYVQLSEVQFYGRQDI